MAQGFDICIRGAGIVGQTLALLLARERLRVALVRGPAPSAAGHADIRAYALSTASRQLLQSLRCWPEPAHATPVLHMQVHGDQGGLVHFDAHVQQAEALAWITDVPALENSLAQALRYQPDIELVDAPVDAPLTVVCEGRASSTRAELGIEFDVTPYGQTAIAARVQCAEPHAQTARQWFAADGILAYLPLGGVGGKEVAVVWSVPTARAHDLLALTDDAFTQQLSQSSQGALGPLGLLGARHAWPLQLARARHWCGAAAPGKSWALAGDAAHTVHPLSGQGLNLGLGDAQALARRLAARADWRSVADLRVLRQYERERKTALVPMRLSTDGLAQLFARPEPLLQSLRNWGMQGFDRSGPIKQWVARQAMHPPTAAAFATAFPGNPNP